MPFSRFHKLSRILLIAIYFPLSIFGILGFLAAGNLNAEAYLILRILTQLFTYCGLLMPIFAIVAMIASKRLYALAHYRASLILRFLPLAAYLLLALAIGAAEGIYYA